MESKTLSYFSFFLFDPNRGNLYPISDLKGVKNRWYPLVPLTPCIALRKHSLGLAAIMVMSYLSFIVLLPFILIVLASKDLLCKPSNLDYQRMRGKGGLDKVYWLELALFKTKHMSVLCFSCIPWSISSLCVVPYRTLHALRADWFKPALEIIFLTSKISNLKIVILIHFLKFLRRALYVLWSQNNPCLSNHFRVLKQRYRWSRSIQSREDKVLSWYSIIQTV